MVVRGLDINRGVLPVSGVGVLGIAATRDNY